MSNKLKQFLDEVYKKSEKSLAKRNIKKEEILLKLDNVGRCVSNRAAIRLLLSCILAKIDNPTVDPRKPYTEINSEDSFSGRTYDERYLTSFIKKYHLPCNPTTAFLTPALRNMDRTLTMSVDIIGRPRFIYKDTLFLLNMVHQKKIKPVDLFFDAIRILISVRNERKERLETALKRMKPSKHASDLSSEDILFIIKKHLACKNSSRLPVLIVAAAYKTIEDKLGENIRSLKHHLAADKQTGALGDIEITLKNENKIVTCYEMKQKKVDMNDILHALEKIKEIPSLDNYIFITTEAVDEDVFEFVKKCYRETGTEIAILDCVGFIHHFLHLFHRMRMDFLNRYQELLLAEPHNIVSQSLKEAFLTLRHATEKSKA